MDEGDHDHRTGRHLVDEPVSLDEKFSNLSGMSFRNDPASFREAFEGSRRSPRFTNKSRRIEAGVTCDEFGSLGKVQKRGFSPAYGSSHFAIR